MKVAQAPRVVIASYNIPGLLTYGSVYCMPLTQLRNGVDIRLSPRRTNKPLKPTPGCTLAYERALGGAAYWNVSGPGKIFVKTRGCAVLISGFELGSAHHLKR